MRLCVSACNRGENGDASSGATYVRHGVPEGMIGHNRNRAVVRLERGNEACEVAAWPVADRMPAYVPAPS